MMKWNNNIKGKKESEEIYNELSDSIKQESWKTNFLYCFCMRVLNCPYYKRDRRKKFAWNENEDNCINCKEFIEDGYFNPSSPCKETLLCSKYPEKPAYECKKCNQMILVEDLKKHLKEHKKKR